MRSVSARRPRTVIDHILEHGQITTEELRDIYGYNHPPRAIRDVREHGIPIETFRVLGSDGRRIAAYRFGDPSEQRAAQLSGRTAFSAALKRSLIERYGARCNLYLVTLPENELQIDHRVPFEISGDAGLSAIPVNTCSSVRRQIELSRGVVSTARTGRPAKSAPASHVTGHRRSSTPTLQ